MKNNKGLKTDSCGTPIFKTRTSEFFSSICSYCSLFCEKLVSSWRKNPQAP